MAFSGVCTWKHMFSGNEILKSGIKKHVGC